MKVLAYTSPARGHLFPILPTLTELLSRGHAVALRTLEPEVANTRGLGIDAAAIDPAIERTEHDDFLGRNAPDRVRRSMATFLRRAPLEIDDLGRAIEQQRPDLLIVDCMCLGGMAAAERSRLPWAQWFPYPLPLTSPDVPPFGPGFAPASGPLSRLRDRVLRPVITRQIANTFLPQLNELRASVGVEALDSSDALYTRPPLTLYMTAEPLEYPRSDWPASIAQVGPCAWDPPAETPPWLAEIDRPIVLVTTSSEFQNDAKLIDVALEALADEDVFVVATVPAASPPAQAPDNARVERFLPHAEILKRAACAITHGGAGATQKALAAGVPVCVVPFGRDQLEVARRVEHAGAGTRLPATRLNAERLRGAVREAIAMRAGAERVAEGFADAGGAARAADLVEALNERRTRPQP
jgi:MGT family glycosyltransferase